MAVPGGGSGGGGLAPIIRRNFGVVSEVILNPIDVDIMTEMGDMIVRLHQLAQRMNGFAGFNPTTRGCIRLCRQLATELQEEIELRRGPTQ
jgi:hypothetical protein